MGATSESQAPGSAPVQHRSAAAAAAAGSPEALADGSAALASGGAPDSALAFAFAFDAGEEPAFAGVGLAAGEAARF